MNEQQIMTQEEIHSFGVEVVFNQLKKEGYQIESVNTDINMNPQIAARKDDELAFILVRTACYPKKGESPDDVLIEKLARHAKRFNAACYFASVGIANAGGNNEDDISIPIRGAGFYIAYKGLEALIFPTSET